MAALLLLALVGSAAYGLMAYYFQQATDLALRYKMAQEFRRLGAALPPELAAAESDWFAGRGHLFPRARPARGREDDDERRERHDESEADEYDGELGVIFVLPLDGEGRLVFDPNPVPPPLGPDRTAAQAAVAAGADLRTVRLDNGTDVRLLTYRLPRADGPALLQLGRILNDQERILSQLLLGLLALGGAATALLGAASWWLAGRSLAPLQLAWERQQTFVANASHELRTPLTLMRASAEVGLRHAPPGDTELRSLLKDVVQETDHMARLVEDLLLLSRLDAGRLPLALQAVDLAELLRDLARQADRLAAARGVRLVVEEADGIALADPDRLRQVVLILVDNALRHTPAGGTISLAAGRRGREVQVSVVDNGKGIAAEDLPHVFERFYRGAHEDAPSGTGLGLAIARALVEAQGGSIRLTSQVERGTRVEVTLPTADRRRPSAAPAPPATGTP